MDIPAKPYRFLICSTAYRYIKNHDNLKNIFADLKINMKSHLKLVSNLPSSVKYDAYMTNFVRVISIG